MLDLEDGPITTTVKQILNADSTNNEDRVHKLTHELEELLVKPELEDLFKAHDVVRMAAAA